MKKSEHYIHITSADPNATDEEEELANAVCAVPPLFDDDEPLEGVDINIQEEIEEMNDVQLELSGIEPNLSIALQDVIAIVSECLLKKMYI